MNKRIILAYPYTDADGKQHKPDTTISLPKDTADQLVFDGLARAANEADEADKKGPTK